ncbi:MAG: DUF3168 domain-containing protein [Phyllobacterium sp.]
MEEFLTSRLLSSAGVTAHVSNNIYWGRAPQGILAPFVVLQRISGIRDYTMQRASGYVSSRVQVDVYASTYLESKTTARAVIAELSGHRGGPIQGIFIDSERDLPATDAGEVNHLHRTSVDIFIHHSE